MPIPLWRSSVSAVRQLLRHESQQYLQKKLDDHRAFMVFAFFLAALLGPALWLWDYVTDPVGASNTVGLRSLYLSVMVFGFAFSRSSNRRLLALASMGTMLLLEGVFLEILNRLHQGMTYGNGGFLIFLYAPLILFSGFSLRLNLWYVFLVAASPQLLAASGFAPEFQHRHYAVLIWPTAVTMMLIQFAAELNYRRRYELEVALAHASKTDPLTGVSNRRYFLPLVHHELIRAERLGHRTSMLLLDIDRFKLVNDTHGHPTGDRVICTLADICVHVCRRSDLVARLGGEEFAILLPETDLDAASALAERIRLEVEKATVTGTAGQGFQFTVSIGVAEQPTGNTSDDTLISLADAAMYKAKEHGRNRVSFR